MFYAVKWSGFAPAGHPRLYRVGPAFRPSEVPTSEGKKGCGFDTQVSNVLGSLLTTPYF